MLHSVYQGSTLAGSQIVAGRAASIQFSWGGLLCGLLKSGIRGWWSVSMTNSDQVLIATFASAMDSKGFAVDLGVPFFNFCQAAASTLNSFPSLGFLLHKNQP